MNYSNLKKEYDLVCKQLTNYNLSDSKRAKLKIRKDEIYELIRYKLPLDQNIMIKMTEKNKQSAKSMIAMICDNFGFTPETIKKKTRQADYVYCRQMICHILKDLLKTDVSLKFIANELAIDHSTVIYSIGEAKNRLETDKDFIENYSEIFCKCKLYLNGIVNVEKLSILDVKILLKELVNSGLSDEELRYRLAGIAEKL